MDAHRPMRASELQAAFAVLPVAPKDPPELHTWPRYLWNIRKHVKEGDPNRFLTWSTLHATMFVGDGASFTAAEVEALKKDDWERWKAAITESIIGHPPHMKDELSFTTGNLIHQAFHLLQFEQKANKRVHELDRIVEFGGGYGAMAAICRRLGFRGEYVIYDNDEMSLIQQFYLSNLGFEASFSVTNGHEFDPPGEADLLIALYSLSEVSSGLRSAWMEITDFEHYLIVHQAIYFGADLGLLFDGIMDEHPDKEWVTIDSPIHGHRYVIGLPRD